jgi:hypothetical protein
LGKETSAPLWQLATHCLLTESGSWGIEVENLTSLSSAFTGPILIGDRPNSLSESLSSTPQPGIKLFQHGGSSTLIPFHGLLELDLANHIHRHRADPCGYAAVWPELAGPSPTRNWQATLVMSVPARYRAIELR